MWRVIVVVDVCHVACQFRIDNFEISKGASGLAGATESGRYCPIGTASPLGSACPPGAACNGGAQPPGMRVRVVRTGLRGVT